MTGDLTGALLLDADDDEIACPPWARVILRYIGNADTAEGKRLATAWSGMVGRPLPLVEMPDLGDLRITLIDEFPHAESVIDLALGDLSKSNFVRIRPTVLVGESGNGKSYFATRLLYHLGVPSQTYACGGVNDGALAGSSRRWNTGEPSLPVALIRRYDTASPGVVLDELEKVAVSRQNGCLLDSLLAFLEPRTAGKFFDPYLETDVDLSHVIWLATANDVGALPGPLKDRCRIIRFPEPTAEHVPALARNLISRLVAEKELDPRWHEPLCSYELAALRNAWKGGSVRRLARLLDGVLAAREQVRQVH